MNAQYVGFEWNYTYIVFCGFIVWLIIPGIGLLYSGLARRKSALALLFQSLMIVAVLVQLLSETNVMLLIIEQNNFPMDILGLFPCLCP